LRIRKSKMTKNTLTSFEESSKVGNLCPPSITMSEYVDPKRLTEAAMAVCRDLHLSPEDLYDRTLEEFERDMRKES